MQVCFCAKSVKYDRTADAWSGSGQNEILVWSVTGWLECVCVCVREREREREGKREREWEREKESGKKNEHT